MVTRSYMLGRPAPPSRAAAYVHQKAIPALIDAAGAMEGQLERLSIAARRAPAITLGVALGVGWLGYRFFARRPHPPSLRLGPSLSRKR